MRSAFPTTDQLPIFVRDVGKLSIDGGPGIWPRGSRVGKVRRPQNVLDTHHVSELEADLVGT
jgi:hypothetical protein